MREKKRTFIRIIWINLDNNTKYIYMVRDDRVSVDIIFHW